MRMNVSSPASVAILVCLAGCPVAEDVVQDTEGSSSSGGSSGANTTTVSTSASTTSQADSSTTDPTVTTTMTTTTTMGETDPTETSSSTTYQAECDSSIDCNDPDSPVCVDGSCVGCSSDQQCEEKNANVPACDDSGHCVECSATNTNACEGTVPLCDTDIGSCVGCTFHEQCPGAACHIYTGACFAPTSVIHVGPTQTFTTIASAVASVMDGEEAVLLVDAGSYNEPSILVTGDRQVAILAADDDAQVTWVDNQGTAHLVVDNGAEAYLQSLRVTLNLNSGLEALQADGAALYLDRMQFFTNDHGAVAFVGGATGQIRSSFVMSGFTTAGVVVSDSTLDVVYSTLGAMNANALYCEGAFTTNVRNSFLVRSQSSPAVSCDGATFETSAAPETLDGTANVELPAFSTAWFANYGGGDLSLTASAPDELLTAAVWLAGDPSVDFHGDARPNVEGTADAAGADLP